MSMFHGYECNRALEIFEDLCQIPHGSGNESGIADYVEKFADRCGAEHYRDETGNVFIRKGATKEYENSPAILLQGHMDMVCEADAGYEHDFLSDPLDLFVENGLLGARGTSLGGDNGIAVAMMLALIETENHPVLECLFTVEEETGLAGAKGFDCSQITAKRMINLDSEEENTVTAGCAGGVRTDVLFKNSKVDLQTKRQAIEIKVGGLAGGHSGADINSGRSNALVILARLLQRALSERNVWLCDICGGGKDNAIARDAEAVVICEDIDAFKICVADEAEKIRAELCKADSGFYVSLSDKEADSCFDTEGTNNILGFLGLVKTGVLKFSNQIDGLVEYSRNLGIVKTDGDTVKITLSSRSSVEAQIDLSCRELSSLASLTSAQCSHYSRYPGWEYNANSSLRDEYIDTYEQLYGVRPQTVVIHAGLECGIISSKTEGLDIISIGPDMYDIHSPAERLSLASCEKIWKVLVTLLSRK